MGAFAVKHENNNLTLSFKVNSFNDICRTKANEFKDSIGFVILNHCYRNI